MSDREANAELTWPQNSGVVHAQLDSTASCSICNDFYDTPLVLPCGHSFCSNCIRSYVSHQQAQAKCPQCRAACDERDLRPNTALRDLVDKLLQARPLYIAALRNHKPGHSRLVKASQAAADDTPDTSCNKRQLRSSRASSAPAPVSPTLQEAEEVQVQESPRKRQRLNNNSSTAAAASGSQPVSAKSKAAAPQSADVAACPICNRNFKAGRVLEAHVNRCIDNPPSAITAQDAPERQQQLPQQQQQHIQRPASRKGVPQLKVPAKIAFHLFNDKKLRDKLRDVNLPITGKRKELEDRYNRLRLEVQLAADKGEAASESDLVRRAMAKEKSALPAKGFFGAAKGATKGSGGLDTASDDPDMPEVEYGSFAALIEATKARDAARKAKQQQASAATLNPEPDSGPEREAAGAARANLPQAADHSSDADASTSADREHGRGQQADRQSADYPESGGQLLAVNGQAGSSLRSRSMPSNSSPGNDNAQNIPDESKRQRYGGSINFEAADTADLRHANQRSHVQPGRHLEVQSRVDLTLDDTLTKHSQESVDVELDDDSSPLPSQRKQDQRALQQLQLLNKSADHLPAHGACHGKSIQSSQEKDPVLSSVPYHQPVVNQLDRTEGGLGALDDIIEDTDSDIEGRLQ